MEVGAACTLTRMMTRFKELIATLPRHQTSGLQAVVHQLR